MLRGLERFRILEEDQSRSYRRAEIEPLIEYTLAEDDRAAIRQQRTKLEHLLAPAAEKASATLRHSHSGSGSESKGDIKIPSAMSDEDLVNALAQYLQLDPLERQALLERDGVRARSEALVELLEMKTLSPKGTNWRTGSVH